MESKRKKRQVHKAQTTPRNKPTAAEALLAYNAKLVEELFASEAWQDIVFPLLQESIAGVSGRFTNGRFYQGTLTRTASNPEQLRGYQLALEEFHNHLHDFILARNNIILNRREEEANKKAPLYNTFLEELNGETNNED